MNPRHKKRPKITTQRPPPDAAPVSCWRWGVVVIVESNGRREVLTSAEARRLSAALLDAADVADSTPTEGKTGSKTRQMPDD